MTSDGKPGGIRGPWVVLVTFAIIIAAAGIVLLIVLFGPEPPEQPAPPEASLVPRMQAPPADAAPAPSQP